MSVEAAFNIFLADESISTARTLMLAIADADCGDSACRFAMNKKERRRGMTTNGGCQCFGDRAGVTVSAAIKRALALLGGGS